VQQTPEKKNDELGKTCRLVIRLLFSIGGVRTGKERKHGSKKSWGGERPGGPAKKSITSKRNRKGAMNAPFDNGRGTHQRCSNLSNLGEEKKKKRTGNRPKRTLGTLDPTKRGRGKTETWKYKRNENHKKLYNWGKGSWTIKHIQGKTKKERREMKLHTKKGGGQRSSGK